MAAKKTCSTSNEGAIHCILPFLSVGHEEHTLFLEGVLLNLDEFL